MKIESLPYIWDFYQEDGARGVIVAFHVNGRIEFGLLGDQGILHDDVLKDVTPIWPLPSKPILEDDPHLDRDLQSFIMRNVEFVDDRFGSLVAHWITATYLSEFLTHFPRLVFYGPTHSGKSRALKILRLLSFRPCSSADATGAAIFRTIDKFRTTIIQDEYQQMTDDKKKDYDSIFRAGFEKEGYVVRCDQKNEPVFYFPWGPMAIGNKKGELPEDMENRSILIPMSQKTRDDVPRRVDENEARDLRTRLYALRYKVISNYDSYRPFFDEAWTISERPILTDAGEVELIDRSIDMAANLIIGDLITQPQNHTYREDLEIIAISEEKARETLRNSVEARVFYSLQTVVEVEKRETGQSDINVFSLTSTDVAEQYNKDLQEQGNEGKEKVKTHVVGKILRELGFDFINVHSGKSAFDPKNFNKTYARLLMKYGHRRTSSSEKGGS